MLIGVHSKEKSKRNWLCISGKEYMGSYEQDIKTGGNEILGESVPGYSRNDTNRIS